MGPSPWQLIIVLVIIVLVFGTKKLRNMGSDLGSAMKNFKSAFNDKDDAETKDEGRVIENKTDDEVIQKTESKENQNK